MLLTRPFWFRLCIKTLLTHFETDGIQHPFHNQLIEMPAKYKLGDLCEKFISIVANMKINSNLEINYIWWNIYKLVI